MHPLDELTIPQPPYRRARPEVRLASADLLPEIPSAEMQGPPEPIVDPEVLKREEQIASFHTDAQSALERIDSPESALDAVVREGVLGIEKIQLNRVADQVSKDAEIARVHAVEEMFRETHVLTKAEARQQAYGEKTETEKKKQFTRDWTAAIKEDAARSPQPVEVPSAESAQEFEPGDAMLVRPGSPEAESVRQAIEAADQGIGAVELKKPQVAPVQEPEHIWFPEQAEEKIHSEDLAVDRLRPSEQPVQPFEVGRQTDESVTTTPSAEVGNDTIYVKPGEKIPASRVEAPATEKISAQEEQMIEREYRGGIFNKIKELSKLVVERTRVLPFMETILPKLESVGARRMVEYRKTVQARAQRKFDRAQEKYEYWQAATKSSGAKAGIFCAWRERAWARRMHNAEGRVNRHDALRERWISTHNGFQERVKRRYDRELAPQVERVAVLGDRVRAIEGAQKELEAMLQEAVQKKASIDARERAKGSRMFSQGAQKAIRELNREIKETERRVRQASKEAARLRAPLARAEGRVAKIGSRMEIIKHRMAFGDMEKYQRVSPVAEESFAESAVTPVERKQERMTPMTLVEKWNRLNLHPRIEDTKQYIAFVTDAIDARPDLASDQHLLELTEKYLRQKYTHRDTKNLPRDIAFFRNKFLS